MESAGFLTERLPQAQTELTRNLEKLRGVCIYQPQNTMLFAYSVKKSAGSAFANILV